MEHFVPVKWIKALPKSEAYREKGFFANQKTLCKLRNRFTRGKLIRPFELGE